MHYDLGIEKGEKRYSLHPTAVRTGKSRAQLTFRQIAGIRESAFSISNLFTISEGEKIIREGSARWPDMIAGELKLLKGRLVD